MVRIYDILERLNLTSKETRVLFSNNTRDVEGLSVWKDTISGVIYIDDYYTGDSEYIEGSYRAQKQADLKTGTATYERNVDARRRFTSIEQFIAGKRIIEFGCGGGEFLKLANQICADVQGIELQADYVKDLNQSGIRCVTNVVDVADTYADVCVSFHVLEHLPDPFTTLNQLKSKLVSGGRLILEVPHANDMLLSTLSCESFKDFTLWSQHLILHTRESLMRLLQYVGFKNVRIEGIQRYSLSNHLNWLANGRAGGHKSLLSVVDTPELVSAYEASLRKLDITDTLVAYAETP